MCSVMKLFKILYFSVFLYCNRQVHRDFLIALYIPTTAIIFSYNHEESGKHPTCFGLLWPSSGWYSIKKNING